MTGLPVRSGLHRPLEDAANDLLRRSLSAITKHSDKSDVLTPWKETERRRREVYVMSGTPDPALRKGDFHRAYNPALPHLNSREAPATVGRYYHTADWPDDE